MDDDNEQLPSIPEIAATDAELDAASQVRGLDPFIDALWLALQPYREQIVQDAINRLAEIPEATNPRDDIRLAVEMINQEQRYKAGTYQQFERRLYPDDDPRHASQGSDWQAARDAVERQNSPMRDPFAEPIRYEVTEHVYDPPVELEYVQPLPVERDLHGRIPLDPHYGCARRDCQSSYHQEGRA